MIPGIDTLFARAALYRARPRGDRVREAAPGSASAPFSERHLQCVWFDAGLRPAALVTGDGEEVRVEDPGIWNLEAGPDFLGAALRIGPERRRVAGDIEVHIHPRDWTAHGHGADPRYRSVRAHVTFFPSRAPIADLPPGCLRIALQPALAAMPGFAFEMIDLAAYPHAARGEPPPCQMILRGWTPDEKQAVLDAAGEERLRRKALALATRMEEAGADQAVYEEVFAALGYKHNKAPSRHLAALVPIDALRDASAGDPLVAEALLLGVAGLLPSDLAARWEEPVRRRVRALWDAWWKRGTRWSGRVMDRARWRLAGVRPTNNPCRRIAAAARWAIAEPAPADRWRGWGARGAAAALLRMRNEWPAIEDPFWSTRLAWNGAAQREPVALVGADRADSIVLNVGLPFLAATGTATDLRPSHVEALPYESRNSIVRQTALNLFGPDHPESWYRAALRRQGLVQVFHDYCLNDRSRCASCTFPALLAGWQRSAPEVDTGPRPTRKR